MPTYSLEPHPDCPPLAVRGIKVEVLSRGDGVLITYRIINPERVAVPEWRTPGRADDLWRTTCFEMFLQPEQGEAYYEFNFSPSTRWAVYGFAGYRDGMAGVHRDVDPLIKRLADGVEVDCDLGNLPRGDLRMALTAVIEEEGGVRSYWSLAHPPGAPDFHHPACFTATLPAVGAA